MRFSLKIFFRFILGLSFIMIKFGCEKDVILDLARKEGAFLIVDANISDNGNRQWIILSKSSSYYDVGKGEPFTGADVKISDGERIFLFSESKEESLRGYYYSDQITFWLKEGTYNLVISTPEKKFTATSIYRKLPILDSLTLALSFATELGFTRDTIYNILAHFRQLPAPNEYYLFNLYVNDTLLTVRPNEKGLVSDENLKEYTSLSVLNINNQNIKPGDKLTLEMRSISRENFEFYNIFFVQTDLSGNPFAGAPPANIPTNLSTGARGFFQVSQSKKSSINFKRR